MNFNRKFHLYDEHACVQKIVADNLLQFFLANASTNEFSTALEIGCGTGFFTKIFTTHCKVHKLIANDIFDTKKYIQNITSATFLQGDIEQLTLPHVDIVVSSSALQWIQDFNSLMRKISQATNELVFSMYIKDNLPEINHHFGISLNYLTMQEITTILKQYFKVIHSNEDMCKQQFSSPLHALRHLRDTGVTGFQQMADIKSVRSFKSTELTYAVGYFHCVK